ncbi:hypothetical protein [Methanobrevibacter millerae]|uniref:Uncharacterized protein n=1 Tax=Methanobrevibacter millerae TaxID=230361 RepID=A0A0U3E5L8_9EURY|nr:hypothetical protein [Methanobrevibacter millerae]ALT68224.1 hypothetical protein sm9_0422 [Methanobrevibacter millerae]
MYELKKSINQRIRKETIVVHNFQALEEAIAEISESENINNERKFFALYEIRISKLDS